MIKELKGQKKIVGKGDNTCYQSFFPFVEAGSLGVFRTLDGVMKCEKVQSTNLPVILYCVSHDQTAIYTHSDLWATLLNILMDVPF